MPIDERWDEMGPSDWEAFASAWVEELRVACDSCDSNVGESVVMMNFTARPEHQWRFICASLHFADTDEELGHIAAGPMEHLMSRHGANYIDIVEAQAAADPKFARMLRGVWKDLMSDEVWQRIQILKARYSTSAESSP